jgi:hypothetical protein
VKVLLPVVVGLGLCAGCAAEIGDECGSNVDCSTNGDRVCDTSAPGGYCTILGCRAGTCPEEAVCVVWDDGVAERQLCMRTCGSGSDCRDDYQCFDPTAYEAAHRDDPGFEADDYGIVLPRGSDSRAKFCTLSW